MAFPLQMKDRYISTYGYIRIRGFVNHLVQVALNKKILVDHRRLCDLCTEEEEGNYFHCLSSHIRCVLSASFLTLPTTACCRPLFANIISYTFSSTTFLPKAKNLFIFAFFSRKFASSQFNFATAAASTFLAAVTEMSSYVFVAVAIHCSHEAFSSPFFTLERTKKSLLNFSLLCTKA